MNVSIQPSIDQVLWYTNNAINSYETLSDVMAKEQVIRELSALKEYLSSVNSADNIAVLVSEGTEIPTRFKSVTCHDK